MTQLTFSTGALNIPPAPTFLTLAADPTITSYAGGVPDPALFPIKALQDASVQLFSENGQGRAAFQYAASQGLPELREWISRDMGEDGIACQSESILITNGAQQALDLIAKLLISPGDLIAVTKPTFFAAIDTFNVYSPNILDIPFHHGCLDMDIAVTVIKKRPKFLYLIPDFQNPTGLSISKSQREQIGHLCAEYDVTILEDAAYTKLYFGEKPEKAFAADDGAIADERVIYVNTFSKTIAPGVRVGWIGASSRLIEKLKALKLSGDVHTSSFNQLLVHFVAENYLQKSLPTIRKAYSEKCSALLRALDKTMPENCWWSKPAGGLFVWLELPTQTNTRLLLEDALSKGKIAFVPGELSAVSPGCENSLRLSFATVHSEIVEDSMSRLATIIKASEKGENA